MQAFLSTVTMVCISVFLALLPLVAAAPGNLTPWTLRGCVNLHNRLRATHSANPLAYDMELQRRAQDWANRCDFHHDPNPTQGQNIYVSPEQGGGKDFFKLATEHWYNEEKKYRQEGGYSRAAGANLGDTGHFTQVVWRATNKVGCAKQTCPQISGLGTKGTIVVCNYSQPGNFPNQFNKQVLPPGAHYALSR